jgi:hypothetical protein
MRKGVPHHGTHAREGRGSDANETRSTAIGKGAITLKRCRAVLALASVGVLVATPSAGAVGGACPASFHKLSIDQAVEIKIALGYPLTPEELAAALRGVDQNRDEIVCSLDLPDTRVIPPFISNMLDNKASVP